eukprot:TRINITY_DN83295_c0_g1_i1.p1 TRINITY_DN83295_c0_g1~~TRINITY_DN83295_c0_g1_i1.p1  ORF type:complete len:618 (-),score=131.32 TRINITY_DN83295_c0_g1_i1:49-1902(-)
MGGTERGDAGAENQDSGYPLMRREKARHFDDHTPAALVQPTKTEGRLFGYSDNLFQIEHKIGGGGQAFVFRCKQTHTGWQFAAKIIRVAPGEEKKGDTEVERKLQNVRREIRNMRQMHHPKIVNLHASFYEPAENPTECILVMDLATGGDLHSKVEKEVQSMPCPFKGLGGAELGSQYVSRQILEGMGYMHSRDVIHRDLKLENILIVRAWEPPKEQEAPGSRPKELLDVKITDFGLSRRVEERALARSLTPVGTLGFVAPEVLKATYDERSDFWSYGVMVYLMLCGQYPFSIQGHHPDKYHTYVQEIVPCMSWDLVSELGKSFVQGLLTINREDRLNLHHALHHQWIESMPPLEQMPELPHAFSVASEGDAKGIVGTIRSWYGAAVDAVSLRLRNGQNNHSGGSGGVRHFSTFLDKDELIIAVAQEGPGLYMGTALVFYTSLGRVIEVRGDEARRRGQFAAPSDSQIVGLQFAGPRLVGILVEDIVDKDEGAIDVICGRKGYAVDKLEFKCRDGRVRSYGGNGGEMVGPFTLQKGEYIRCVDQDRRDAYLGNSIAIITSKGNVFSILGMEGQKLRRAIAPEGMQIFDLKFEAGSLASVEVCPKNGDLSIRQRIAFV